MNVLGNQLEMHLVDIFAPRRYQLKHLANVSNQFLVLFIKSLALVAALYGLYALRSLNLSSVRIIIEMTVWFFI